MSVRAVDPARSRIVLVGAARYRDDQLPDVPQISANLADLAAVFTDPQLGGFPEQHCVVASPRAGVEEIGDLLHLAAEAAEDLLLFYFAGHGVLGRDGELYLSLYHTRFRAPEYSALRFETVRGTFLDSRAVNRVVIVDSCYSGRAIGPTLGGEQQAMLGQLEIGGTYTLASAPPNSLALVRAGEQHTAFTGRLLRLLREGSPQAGRLLSLGEIYRHLHARLRAEGLPLPQQRGTATADLLGLVRNRGLDAGGGALADSAALVLQAGERSPALRERAVTALDRAVLFIADMRDGKAKGQALVKVAQVVAALDAARATGFFERVERLAASVEKNQRPVVLAAVAKALAATDPDHAADLFEQAERAADAVAFDHQKPGALAKIAEALAATDPAHAADLFEQAERLAYAITYEHEKAGALAEIAPALAATNPAHAADLFEQLANAAGVWSPLATPARTAEAVAVLGPERVERLAAAMTDRDGQLRVNFVAAVASTDPDRAEHLADTATDERWKCFTLIGIAEALATSDPDRAAGLCEQAERLAAAIQAETVARNGSAKARLLASLAGGLRLFPRTTSRGKVPQNRSPRFWLPDVLAQIAMVTAVFDPARAERIMVEAGRPDPVGAGPFPWNSGLAAVVRALATSDPDRAERLAGALKNPNDLEWAWTAIAQALAASDPDRALLAAHRSYGYGMGEALASIAQVLAAADPDRAEYIAATITEAYWRPVALVGLAQIWLAEG